MQDPGIPSLNTDGIWALNLPSSVFGTRSYCQVSLPPPNTFSTLCRSKFLSDGPQSVYGLDVVLTLFLVDNIIAHLLLLAIFIFLLYPRSYSSVHSYYYPHPFISLHRCWSKDFIIM